MIFLSFFFVFRSICTTFGKFPKVLTFEKTQIYLVFYSLNRTFAGKINANDGKQLKISGSRRGV